MIFNDMRQADGLLAGLLVAVLVLLVFRGGTLLGAWGGHWGTSLTLADYMQLLSK